VNASSSRLPSLVRLSDLVNTLPGLVRPRLRHPALAGAATLLAALPLLLLHPALAVAATLLAALALLLLDPAEVGRSVDCPFHWATGLYCPGCGSLRAMHAMLHGQIVPALHSNALAVIAVPAVLLLAAPLPTRTGAGRSLERLVLSPVLSRTFLIAVLAFWVARNLPFWPLSWLAP
jgi:hypothetical protein